MRRDEDAVAPSGGVSGFVPKPAETLAGNPEIDTVTGPLK
jgi:hypothetical protein